LHWKGLFLAGSVFLAACAQARSQDARQIVEQAVRVELAADANDHTDWLYYEVDIRPGMAVKQWVADTNIGDLTCLVEKNGATFTKAEQRAMVDGFIGDRAAQAKQRRSGQHDDAQAARMLGMLPQAFFWKKAGTRGNDIILDFRPNPQFCPPTWESRVFAAMAGEMAVDNTQHRIVSLKGRMIHDVKFGWGLLGELRAGGTFDVERREVGDGEWQIVQTHVHIQGHALIFKSISDQEDDVKSRFKELSPNLPVAAAEKLLMAQDGNGKSASLRAASSHSVYQP
jgi:hypothetical protein